MAEADRRQRILDVLRYAMREERKAQQRYREWAELEAEPALRDLFRMLADEESRHETLLEEKRAEVEGSGV